MTEIKTDRQSEPDKRLFSSSSSSRCIAMLHSNPRHTGADGMEESPLPMDGSMGEWMDVMGWEGASFRHTNEEINRRQMSLQCEHNATRAAERQSVVSQVCVCALVSRMDTVCTHRETHRDIECDW